MTGLCCDTRASTELYGLGQWVHPGIDGRIGRRVLYRLGLDVDLPPCRIANAYEAFLPEARGIGYWRLLRDSVVVDCSLCSSPHRELDWLAARIQITMPSSWLPNWAKQWRRAEEISGLEGRSPCALGISARRQLLENLAAQANYRDLVSDALAGAMITELA